MGAISTTYSLLLVISIQSVRISTASLKRKEKERVCAFCCASPYDLVLLTNLKEETRHLAPRLAGLLLRMYVLAIPPTTVWLTVFMAAVGNGAFA